METIQSVATDGACTLLSVPVYPEFSQEYSEHIIPVDSSVSDMVLPAALAEGEAVAAALPDISGDDYITVMSSQWTDYISGIVQNMPGTEYIAYCVRDYSGNSYSYTEHYILHYDLQISDEDLIAGSYPYIDIYRPSSSGGYIRSEGVQYLSEVPVPAYGSFGHLSELRKGGGVHETYAILFAIVVAFLFNVASGIFKFLLESRKR